MFIWEILIFFFFSMTGSSLINGLDNHKSKPLFRGRWLKFYWNNIPEIIKCLRYVIYTNYFQRGHTNQHIKDSQILPAVNSAAAVSLH